MRRVLVVLLTLVVLVTPLGGFNLGGVAQAQDATRGRDRVGASQDPPVQEVPPTVADADGDGAPDGADNCGAVPNPDQTDSDFNGVGDACDAPPPPPPPADSDVDGVPDGADNCGAVPNPDQADGNQNGVGDACDAPPPPPDTDADGVADGSDNCPAVPNGDQADGNANGVGDACDVVAPPTATAVPTVPPTDPSPSATPSPSASPSPSATPTPVGLGPDDPSLFGWPAAVGGTPLNYPGLLVPGSGGDATIARINVGGPDVVTADGNTWSADAGFAGGKVHNRKDDRPIAGTADPMLYRTERRSDEDGGVLTYEIPVPRAGAYTVKLHVAALTYPAKGGGFRNGRRVMTVNLEGGAAELSDWDVFKTAEPVVAEIKSFDVQVRDGVLNLTVDASAGRATIAALEVIARSGAGDALVEYAMQYQGLPYIWATSGPTSFDCSGYTNWVVSHVLGVHIGLNQLEQIKYGVAVDKGDLQAGDLVFFANTHPTVPGVSHVGIYMGGGQFIHASAGAGAVVINDLNSGYYNGVYYGAVRIV